MGSIVRDRIQRRTNAESQRGTEDQETGDKQAEWYESVEANPPVAPDWPAYRGSQGARREGTIQGPETREEDQGRAPRKAGQSRNAREKPRAPLPEFHRECNLWNTSAETKLRLRMMDLLRERRTVNVSWWGCP